MNRFPLRAPAALLLTAAVVAPAGSVDAAPPRPADGVPNAAVSPATADMGSLLEGETENRTIRLTNDGDAPLDVMRVHTSCGCAVARLVDVQTGSEIVIDRMKPMGIDPLIVLAPGEHLDVEVTYRSAGQPHRRITKYLDLFTNDPDQERIRVPITVEVRKAFTLQPLTLKLGESQRSGDLSGDVHVTPEPGVDLALTGIQPAPGLDATLEVIEQDDGSKAYVAHVKVQPGRPAGPFSATLALLTDHAQLNVIKVPVFAEILPVVHFDPGNPFNSKLVDFGMLEGPGPHERTIQVTNADPSVPFTINGVEIQDRGAAALEADVETVEPGVRYVIHLTTRPGLKAKFFKGSLLIRAAHPEQKETTLFYSGWTKSG